jgi:hypothetical protein
MVFTTIEQGSRWRARSVGVVASAGDTLAWPDDFLGYPNGIGANQTVSIDSIKLVLNTSAVVANRRPRFFLTDPAHRTLDWHAGVTTPANAVAAIYMFSSTFTIADAIVGAIARGQLPSGLRMQQGYILNFEIITAQVGDQIDEIIVSGSFHG